MTDMEERVARLDTMIAEDRIIRQEWTDGHERACLLAALSPEVGSAGSVSACPAHVMPAWLAYMTPWIDDEVTEDAWPGLIRRYAALARRWSVLDDAAWERARIASLIAIVSEARSHCPADETRALAAADAVIAWLRRGAPGGERAAVAMTARAAVAMTARAARAAVSAAEAAAGAAVSASVSASWASVAAAWSVGAAAWSASALAAEAAAVAARAAASDRIATAVLDAIEAEIERSER